jgi:Bacterial archaeo-eukaryotic release factor family 3
MLKQFLHQTDEGLRQLLESYPIPVFVMGVKKLLGYFKSLTKNEKSIVGYVHGNYEEATEMELWETLKPYVDDWKKIKMKDLHHQLERAADAGKLAMGMINVWKQASQHRGQLLVVEKNFMYAAEHGSDEGVIYKVVEPYNKFSYIKDAVDDVIEKVLENGGDIEFVDEGILKEYQHIALIQYYL